MSASDVLKVFQLNANMFASDLSAIERKYGYELRNLSSTTQKDETFYPQFPAAIRAVAKEMSEHYEIFYCLENMLRDLVSETLEATNGVGWWDSVVPKEVVTNVEMNIKREQDAGVSHRSDEPIDYTTFGELSKIIDSNWESFSDTFNSRKGLISILSRLNLLRGPIAHCSELTEDEVLRLQLSVRDFFRLME